MGTVFLQFLNMSITASFLIVAVILLRIIFKNMPKWIRCLMWGMVGVRLAVPFSFESVFSVIPNAQSYDNSSVSSTAYVATDVSAYSQNVSNEVVNSPFNLLSVISVLWIVGIVIMLGYMLGSYIRVHLLVRESVKVKENIWMCDHINSPFVLGVFNPKIYLISDMNKKEIDYVVAHERAHLKRHDNIWKPLGFVLLCIYWFNPLCWLAYRLFNKDIELACDEKVIKDLGKKSKKAYSNALLSCSAESKLISACPLAFGENNVKQRIKNVLSYKNPKIYVVVSALAVCAVVGVMFMTNPLSASAKDESVKNPENSIIDVSDDLKKIKETTVEVVTEPEPTTEPTTVAETTVKVTEPVPTEPETEEEVVEDYYEESYSDDYYDDSYYSEDTYSEADESSNNSGFVEIQPIEESESYKKTLEQSQNIYDEYGSTDLLSGVASPMKKGDPSPDPNERFSEDIFIWDIRP